MAKARYLTAPVWNNPETEAAHKTATAIPYFEPKSNDTHHDRKQIKPTFGPGKGETWTCDDDVQYWKDAMQGNLYSPVRDEGYRLRANNGKEHDGFVEVGYINVGSTARGNCMYWPIATGTGTKDGIKGCSFYIHSTGHGYGGTNSDGTNRYRHNTWLRRVGVSLLAMKEDNGQPQWESGTKWWGSEIICTAGDQAGGTVGKFVTMTFSNDLFSEAARVKSLGYLPLCTSVVFQLWTGVRSGINSGSSDSTLSFYDFKMHYAFAPESANADKCLMLPAWTHTPAKHYGSGYAPGTNTGNWTNNQYVRLGYEG